MRLGTPSGVRSRVRISVAWYGSASVRVSPRRTGPTDTYRPSLTAVAVLDAVKAGRFYILTHPKIKGAIETRMRDILDERLPTNTMPA